MLFLSVLSRLYRSLDKVQLSDSSCGVLLLDVPYQSTYPCLCALMTGSQSEFYDDLARGHLAGNTLFTCLAIHRKETRTTEQLNGAQPLSMNIPVSTLISPSSNVPASDLEPIGKSDLYASTFGMDEELGITDDHTNDFTGDPTSMDNQILNGDIDIEPISFVDDTNNHEHVFPCASFDVEDQGGEDQEVIAGCVVGSFMPLTRLPDLVQNLLISNPQRHGKLFYIMTLGTASEYRMAGLGSHLVQQCMDQVEQDPRCGALYLHVITHNQGAIRLYEKLGFYRVQEIPDYYDIDGEKYPCFLYAKYYHGNRGHRAIYRVFTRYLYSLVRQVLNFAHIPHTFLLGTEATPASGDPGF